MYRLGQPVRIASFLYRDTEEVPVEEPLPKQPQTKTPKGFFIDFYPKPSYKIRRVWKRMEKFKPREGVITGRRTLVEGTLVSGNQYDRGYLDDRKYVEVYLVVTNPRENPVRVLPKDITPLDL